MRSWRPILEPSPRGKHDRFYDLLSRLLFSPRRTPSSRAPCSLVARVQLLAPLYSVYTSRRLRFFGSRRATRPGSSGIERRVESSARSRVQQAHTFPYTRRRRSENGSDLRTDALSLRSASSTSGPTSKRTELFSTDREREREGEREIGVLWEKPLPPSFDYYSRRTILLLLFLPPREGKKESCTSGTCLVTENLFVAAPTRATSAALTTGSLKSKNH